jgi:hypothetical protein
VLPEPPAAPPPQEPGDQQQLQRMMDTRSQ